MEYLGSLSWRALHLSFEAKGQLFGLSFELALKITFYLSIGLILLVIFSIPRLLPLVKFYKEQGTSTKMTMGRGPTVSIWSSSCPLDTPPRAPARLCGNISNGVGRDTRCVSFSPYKKIYLSFIATPLVERSPRSSSRSKVNACRVN